MIKNGSIGLRSLDSSLMETIKKRIDDHAVTNMNFLNVIMSEKDALEEEENELHFNRGMRLLLEKRHIDQKKHDKVKDRISKDLTFK